MLLHPRRRPGSQPVAASPRSAHLVLTLMERAMAVNWKEIDRKRAATGKCAGRRSTWCSWQSGCAERARKAAAVIG
jgi:hypothetical protein